MTLQSFKPMNNSASPSRALIPCCSYFFFISVPFSVPVLRSAVLISGLLIVMPLTQRLPVVCVPEQPLIPTVRNDVIDYRCLGVATLFLTHHAQWVRSKVSRPSFLPGTVITSGSRRPDFLRMEGFVLCAVFLPGLNQLSASWMTTWNLRSVGHLHSSQRRLLFPKWP